MRVRLVQITTRRSGAKARKEQSREVQSLTVGRGTDNDIVLNELTVALQHAAFEKKGGRIHVVRKTAPELLVNGQLTEGEPVEAGDVVKVGHYELRVTAPEGDEDLALEIEQVVRPGDERAELRKRTQMGVERGIFARRPLAFAAIVLVLSLFLVGPLLSDRVDSVWNSGIISRKHAFIAEDCRRCHDSFNAVPNDGCLECHTPSNHTSAEASPAALNQARCANCHIEHAGLRGLAQIENARCAKCHSKLSEVYSGTIYGNASDFHDEHPEFRFTLITDPRADPELLVWSPDLKENPGVSFNHFLHVGGLEAASDGDNENLRCDNCHSVTEGGRTMKQVNFETHCNDCHSLGFDPDLAGAEVTHGDPVKMREELRNLYTERALRGQATGPDEPAAIRTLRPGQQLSDAETRMVLAWVNQKVEKANERAMASCADCHDLEPDAAEDGGTDVVPARLLQIRMPRSDFRHYTHRPFPCASCHPSAAVYEPDDSVERPEWSLPGAGPYAQLLPDELDAIRPELTPSEDSSDVMLPSIESCRSCHGGARSRPPLVASACVLCHPFHKDEFGSMAERLASVREKAAAEAATETE